MKALIVIVLAICIVGVMAVGSGDPADRRIATEVKANWYGTSDADVQILSSAKDPEGEGKGYCGYVEDQGEITHFVAIHYTEFDEIAVEFDDKQDEETTRMYKLGCVVAAFAR